MQRNLLSFNDNFSSKLTNFVETVIRLDGIFDRSIDALQLQKDIFNSIEKTKVGEMTKYNVAVLKQLDFSVGKFEKFNSYLSNITQFVENSQQIVNSTNELLIRTDNFKTIANSLDNKLNQSQQLLEFLSAHFNKLEEHKEFTSNAVADVGYAISDTFKELKEHIQNSSEAVKQFTIDETDALKTALSESKTNLGNLEHLAALKDDVSQFKISTASQSERLKQAIDELNTNSEKSISLLELIEKRLMDSDNKRVINQIKNLFGSNKE